VTAWKVTGIELPFGDSEKTWWVDESGRALEKPVADGDILPGRYVLAGLVDSHAHPSIGETSSGSPLARTAPETRATLLAWAESGVTLVRDVGSPLGLTLGLEPFPRGPTIYAAGRFLAPEGRYFEELLLEPVSEADLLEAALREVGRGATWVKVIGDFPKVPEFTDVARTYPIALIGELCTAVHDAGARVAVHSTIPGTGELVTAGVDSIEHGTGLDIPTIEEMGRRGVAWTPTLCATVSSFESEDLPPERRERFEQLRSDLKELLPLAVKHGVPILAGTDAVGTIPREVALLSEFGLNPEEALAAASEWPRRFIEPSPDRTDIVTYEQDPREDPMVLSNPAAVVSRGVRLR
jgi:imidazolonepropionase-like amidohydrolase